MAASPDPRDAKLGWLLIHQAEPSSPLPLEHTAISGSIVGPVARVRVIQRFSNPLTSPVELEYLFPLPHEAAVVDYKMTIGTRTIRADIKEREAARQAYQEAVDAGQRASLLEQQRPNLFSLMIGNVQPGDTLICELEYEDRLSFQDGTYEFVFPMGITPRYSSPSESAKTAASANAAIALPDEKIAPFELQLSVDAGVPVADAVSPSHQPQIKRQDDQRFAVDLTGVPNKDFVLRYGVAGDAIRAASWSNADGDSEIALITLIPPRLAFDGEPAPREFIFVIDRSGSMSTDPMEQAKNALRACLRGLNPQDTFAIQAFDDHIEWFSKSAQPVTQTNIDLADRWLDNIASRGGTEILGAIDAALALPVDAERLRYVVFLTDGAVSADEQAIRNVAKKRGSARIFTFGIGPAVNRFLLDKIAQMGRGTAEFIGANEDLESAITRYQDRVSYPALQDIRLDWIEANGWDTYPDVIPDLYIGQPLELVTRLTRQPNAKLRLTGTLRGQPVMLEMPFTPAAPDQPTLKRLWARARVESLTDQARAGGDAESLRQQIISLSLSYRVLTAFTAFVAVDSEVAKGGDALHLRVSTPLPDGLEYENFGLPTSGVFGGIGRGNAVGAPRAMPPSPAAAPPMQGAPSPSRRLSKPSAPRSIDRLKDLGGSGAAGKREPPSPDDFPDWLTSLDSTSADDLANDSLAAAAPPDASVDSGIAAFLRKRREEPTPDSPKSNEAAPDLASIDERIKWLARTQRVNGSWEEDVEMTAAALLAFVRAGHTTHIGSYRQQVRKAYNWLTGRLLTATEFPEFAAHRALGELQTADGGGNSQAVTPPQPTTLLEHVASGDISVSLPNPITTLDDLRVAALQAGNAAAPDALKQGAQSKLVQTWLALGKPVTK